MSENSIARVGGGLDEWLPKMRRVGVPVHEKDLLENSQKEKSLDDLGLPRSRDFGLIQSELEIAVAPTDVSYFVRCIHKTTGEIARAVGLDRSEIGNFVNGLSGGFASWRVELKEFVQPLTAGNIIINGDKVLIETWAGPHYLNIEPVKKFVAKRGLGVGVDKFYWSAYDGKDLPTHVDKEKIQELALRAYKLAYQVAGIDRPKMYFEFYSDLKGKIFFIEAQQSDILTRI